MKLISDTCTFIYLHLLHKMYDTIITRLPVTLKYADTDRPIIFCLPVRFVSLKILSFDDEYNRRYIIYKIYICIDLISVF